MGLFFEDTKPPAAPPPQIIQQQQWWPALILIALLTAIGTALGWILKPLLTYLFTFEGRTRQQISTQMTIFAFLVIVPAFLIYRIPVVRDALSLASTHTLNHSRYGGRVFFPERQYFIPEGARRAIPVGSKIYATYAGYTKNAMQKISTGVCQMIPRSERMGFASIDQPEGAEGFEDEVIYTVVQSVATLRGIDYVWELVARPSVWFDKNKLSGIMVERDKTSTWPQFINNWDLIVRQNDGHRAFEVKALSTEHAVICF